MNLFETNNHVVKEIKDVFNWTPLILKINSNIHSQQVPGLELNVVEASGTLSWVLIWHRYYGAEYHWYWQLCFSYCHSCPLHSSGSRKDHPLWPNKNLRSIKVTTDENHSYEVGIFPSHLKNKLKKTSTKAWDKIYNVGKSYQDGIAKCSSKPRGTVVFDE